MRIKVRLFAGLREALGARQVELELAAGATVADVLRVLGSRSERFARFAASSQFAVNGEYVAPDTPLGEGDEVAFIPPVSGGR